MDPTLSLFAAGAWLLVAFALWRGEGKNQLTLLALACLVAAAGYFGLGRFHGDGRFVHDHELYHHTLGSHYMAELGHHGLYGATCLALVENGRAVEELPELVTDLISYELESGRSSLARGRAVRERFTDERWAAFRADVAFFDGRFRDKGQGGWERVLVDHGHNASPFWSALGGALVGTFGLSPGSLLGFALLDLLLLVGMLLALTRAFGPTPALLFAAFYFANVFAPFGITGGAFLRHLWLAGVVGYACCLKLGRPRLAVVFLAVATLDRIFPAVLILWPVLEALRAARGGDDEQAAGWWTAHTRAVALFGALVVVGLLATGPGAWVAFLANIQAHGQDFYINQISLRSLLTIDPTTATGIFGDEALWYRERSGLDAARSFSLRALRLASVGLIAVALWRERERERGLALLAFVPFLLLYPANYYHLFLGLGLLASGATRRLVVGGMLALFVLVNLLQPDAGADAAAAALEGLARVELLNWWISLAVTGGLVWLLTRSVRDRRAWLAAGACVLLGVGGDLVRREPRTDLDLIPSDVASRSEVLRETMQVWGNGWSRGDHVVVKTDAIGDRASIELDPPGTGPHRLRLDLSTTPVFGRVQVTVGQTGGSEWEALGEPLELYAPRVGLISVLLPELFLEGGPTRVQLEVVGKHPAASHHYLGIDRIAWEPVGERDPAAARAAAETWLDRRHELPGPEAAPLDATAIATKYLGLDPLGSLAGEPDPRVWPMVREYLTDLSRSPALGDELELGPAALDRALTWAVALRDTTTVARLLPLASGQGPGAGHPARAAARSFLLDQQREDGSFGPAEPTSHLPRARTVQLGVEALAPTVAPAPAETR